MTWRAAGSALALCVLASGCAGSSATSGGDSWRALSERTVLLSVVWRADLSTQGGLSAYDVERGGVGAGAGVVIVATSEGGLVGLDARSGEERWRHQQPAESYAAAPVVSDGVAYVPGPDGVLRAMDASSGAARWSQPLGSPIHAAPTVMNDLVCVHATGGTVRLLDREGGEVVAEYSHSGTSQLAISGDSPCTIVGDEVYVGFADGSLASFERDGRQRWLVDVAGGAERLLDVDTRPLVLEDTVIAASFHGGLVAFSRTSGARQWEVPLTGASSPVYAAGAVVTTTASGSVVWVDASTGEVRYELQLDATTAQAPVHIGEILYISTPRGVFLVDAAVPWVYHRFDAGEPVTTLPTTDGHRLFVLSDSGVVYALELREY